MPNRLKTVLKGVLRHFSAKRREAQLRDTQRHVTREDIARDLREMGIAEGDVVFLHSSMKSLGYVEGGPRAVIDALLDAVGAKGTLILPTYYMPAGTISATCQLPDYIFDPRKHGTNMGALPGAFLEVEGVCRSIHPTHSVSALGPHARYLTEAHHLAPSVFGTGSPWQRFHELNGKVLGLGISMGPVTFYHLLEDTMGDAFPEPVWQEKTFHLRCVGQDGKEILVPVRPYKSEYTLRRIDHPSRADLREFMMATLSEAGVITCSTVGTAASWFITGKDFFEQLSKLASRGLTIYSPPEAISQTTGGLSGT